MSGSGTTGRLDGQVCLVTGGTQGVGEAAAHELADRGAQVVIVSGRSVEQGERVRAALAERGCEAVFIRTDLGSTEDCAALVAAVDARYGRLDVLVNAAGTTHRGTILTTTAAEFDHIFAVNVRGPMLLMQGAIDIMQREGIAGHIVNVSSVVADGGPPQIAAYAASKAALNTLSKNAAYAVMRTGIRINVVAPGWIDTPGEHATRLANGDSEDWRDRARASLPFGELIDPADLARMIGFLASDECGVMTGAVVHYDQSVTGAGRPSRPTPEETVRRG